MTDETEIVMKSMDEQMLTDEEMNADMEDTSQINIYFEVDSKLESANDEDYKEVVMKPEEKENVLDYDEFLEKDVKVKT